jgi:hypothetical protein
MDYTKIIVRGHSVDSENKGRSRSPSSHNDNSVKATSSPEQWLTWARYFTQWKEIWEPDRRQCTKHIKLCSLMGCKTAGLYEGQDTWYMGVMPVPPASMPKAQTWLGLYMKRSYNSNTKGHIKCLTKISKPQSKANSSRKPKSTMKITDTVHNNTTNKWCDLKWALLMIWHHLTHRSTTLQKPNILHQKITIWPYVGAPSREVFTLLHFAKIGFATLPSL